MLGKRAFWAREGHFWPYYTSFSEGTVGRRVKRRGLLASLVVGALARGQLLYVSERVALVRFKRMPEFSAAWPQERDPTGERGFPSRVTRLWRKGLSCAACCSSAPTAAVRSVPLGTIRPVGKKSLCRTKIWRGWFLQTINKKEELCRKHQAGVLGDAPGRNHS